MARQERQITCQKRLSKCHSPLTPEFSTLACSILNSVLSQELERIGKMARIKNLMIIAIFCLASCLCSCQTTSDQLRLSQYRRNIVIREDNSILIEKDVIDYKNFRTELANRIVTSSDSIILHVHDSVSGAVLEAVYKKLLSYGYKKIDFRRYADE
jgi:hypothetical protein